jgi:diguanylate cyclase (GGDEF)-like protein
MGSGFMGLLLGTGLGFHFYPAVASLQWMVSAALIVVLVNIIRGSFHMAYRDELTGLPARRALKEQLLKLGRRYSIAMLDVDHFKKFNDRYGHDVGDQVLQMVGTHLARAGGGSKAFRYGGEEFTLVFAGKEAEAVVPCLERLRQEIADTAFIVRDKRRPRKKPGKPVKAAKKKSGKEKKRVQITISIGVSDSSGPEKSPAEVIKAADKALYRAKRKGRNRVAK